MLDVIIASAKLIFAQTFFKRFRTDAVGATFTHVQVNGGLNNQNDPGVEVSNFSIYFLTCY